jgi:hypothetical protein
MFQIWFFGLAEQGKTGRATLIRQALRTELARRTPFPLGSEAAESIPPELRSDMVTKSFVLRQHSNYTRDSDGLP